MFSGLGSRTAALYPRRNSLYLRPPTYSSQLFRWSITAWHTFRIKEVQNSVKHRPKHITANFTRISRLSEDPSELSIQKMSAMIAK